MLKEKRQHSSALIPYSYYECKIPDYFFCASLHWHPEFEINYIRKGSAEFVCGEHQFISQAGDIIIIPPNTLHSVFPNREDTQLYDTLVFRSDMLGIASDDRCTLECIRPLITGQLYMQAPISSNDMYYAEFQQIIERIFLCAKDCNSHMDTLLKSELLRLLWLLSEHNYIKHHDDSWTDISEQIRPAITYINQYYNEPVSIDFLANMVHLSRSYFMGQFKQATGMSAIEYVNQLRIHKACSQLSNTQKRIVEIAFSCGFHNLSNFNRTFRNLVGCTPSEFRQQAHVDYQKLLYL